MPKFIAQPADLGALPVLNDEKTARRKIMVGHNKWMEVRDDIEFVQVGHRRYFTDQALLDYLSRNTRKPGTAGIRGPQRNHRKPTAAAEPAPRKRVPPVPLPPPKRRKPERRVSP